MQDIGKEPHFLRLSACLWRVDQFFDKPEGLHQNSPFFIHCKYAFHVPILPDEQRDLLFPLSVMRARLMETPHKMRVFHAVGSYFSSNAKLRSISSHRCCTQSALRRGSAGVENA